MDKVVILMYISVMRDDWQIEVVRAARSRCPPRWSWHNQPGDKQEINWWLVEDGHCQVLSDGETFHLQRGDCIYQDLYTEIKAANSGPDSYVVSWCDILLRDNNGNILNGQKLLDTLPQRYHRCVRFSFLHQLMERCIIAVQQQPHAQQAARWMRVFIDELIDSDRQDPTEAGSEQSSRLRMLCEQVRLDSGVGWDIAAMARRFSCSKDHFTRLFKSEFGQTPTSYLNRVKIQAAQELLALGDSDIAAIAHELGFYDVYHFSKRFKQATGLSPTAWRKQNH